MPWVAGRGEWPTAYQKGQLLHLKCVGQVCDLPFPVGNGYYLGEREVSLDDHIQHKGWSVFHGSAVPYDGLSWKAYADTKKNKEVNHNYKNKKSKTCWRLLYSVLNSLHGEPGGEAVFRKMSQWRKSGKKTFRRQGRSHTLSGMALSDLALLLTSHTTRTSH